MTEVTERTQTLLPGPAQALSAMLGVPVPDLERGAGLPLLWHWTYLLDWSAQADLGLDGHPVRGTLPAPPVRTAAGCGPAAACRHSPQRGTMRDIALARTFLFVPGDRPHRFGKTAASGAHTVIVDLKDAVAADQKHKAREHIRGWLDQRHEAVVRINGADTPWHADDSDMVAGSPGAIGMVVPKAEDPGRIHSLSRRLPGGTRIVPLVETAAGPRGATAICALRTVVRPAFASVGLAAQLGVDHKAHPALHYVRSALVLAGAAAGCGAPVDGATTSLTDDSCLCADLEHTITLGYCKAVQSSPAGRYREPTTRPLRGRHRVGAAGDRGSSRWCGPGTRRPNDRPPVVLQAQAVIVPGVRRDTRRKRCKKSRPRFPQTD
jgi:citrate lyase subunit beta/citryl-CoA lyase